MKRWRPVPRLLAMLTAFVLSGAAVMPSTGMARHALQDTRDPLDDDDGEEEGAAPGAKKVVTIRGCLHGTTLGDTRADERIPALTSSVTLRASRELRRQLKAFNRHEVEVTGVLTPAPRGPLGGKWGGTTVTVGPADPRRPIGSQTPPPVASMEVEAVKSVAPSCTGQKAR